MFFTDSAGSRMSRVTVDGRPPALALHAIAGREFAHEIPVTGGTLTSPLLTMKTSGGDPYTTDPGVGAASLSDAATLRLAWTAADLAALNTTTRQKHYLIEIAGSVDGSNPLSVIGGTLTVYPTTWARSVPSSSTTLVLNNGTTLTLELTVPAPAPATDGGAMDEVYVDDGIDGGSFDDTFTDTDYDGGSI